jgi:hypothetical protein
MNERIQTLLAKFKETESTHRGAQVLIGLDEIEKFAELIVRECAQVSADFVPGYGLEPFSERFNKHFGVEE